jgi:peroxiredoxin
LAEYRDIYPSLRAAGANLIALSVDSPEKSESVRRQLHLPYPILADTRRRVVREWGIYNEREKGGIAKPAVFLLAPDMTVRFASVDQIASRVPAAEIVRRLSEQNSGPASRKTLIAGPLSFFRGIRNGIRMGATEREG